MFKRIGIVMKSVNKILGFFACFCFSIQGMQQVPKSKFVDPLEGKIPPSLIHQANNTNSTGLGSQQSPLNLSIQLGMQEASQQNKSIPYGVLIQYLTKHSAMAQRINIVMTPIIEKLAQSLNNDIEQIVALKNLSIQISENPTLNEIFNREFQQWADTLIEGLTHFNNGTLVFQPSNGNIRRKIAWMINRYMRLHLVQDQYDAMVKSFMENKIPCFDEIYEYNNSYFWRPHKWIGYSIDFLSTFPMAFRQIKMTERPEFRKLKEIRDLYLSGNKAGAQAQIDQNDTNHQSLWNSLETKYGSKSAQGIPAVNPQPNPQNQLINDKSKNYGLDTAQDFRSVGNKILENCGFVLAGLQNQLPEDVESIQTEFTFAIDHIKNAKSLEEFSYHLSVVDLRVVIAQYVQEYQSQGHRTDSQFRNGLLEKVNQSGQLLGRSIEQFAKRIKYTVTHPQEEIYARVMAPIHLAQMGLSVSKIASQYGVDFMSAEDKWGFVCQTWNKLADMCSQIKAEDFFDGLGVLAADIITQRGLTKVCRYLSKLELAVEKVGKGKKIYEHIEKGVDKVLQRSPMPIPMQTKIPAADIINDLRKRGIHVPDLSERTINTTRALKSHPLYYVIRRTYREINELAPLYEGKYKGFDKCANKFIKFPFKHILAPEFQKNTKDFMAFLYGWHHDYNNMIEKSGLIEITNKRIGKNGVYIADILWRGRKIAEKTFFPPEWRQKIVIEKVMEGYKNFLQNKNFEKLTVGYKVQCLTNCGIELEMYITEYGVVKTVYPLFRELK